MFEVSNVTVDITIQKDEHSSSRSYVSSLVMYNISVSSTIESDLEQYVQETENFTIEIMVPYDLHVQVNMSIVPTLCGLSGGEVPFNISFNYS